MQCAYLLTSLFKNMIPESNDVLKYIFQIDAKYSICKRHCNFDPNVYNGLAILQNIRSGS